MSIATELTLLSNSKQAIKNSINAKGGSITDSTPFADYSTAIDNLPSGGETGNPLLKSIDVSDFTGTTFNQATSYITGVTIPSGVTTISDKALENCSAITSINIPSSVTSIGQSAFQSCSSLTSITIPDTVTSIKGQAFQNCTNLTSVILPNTMTYFGAGVFWNCSSLTSVNVPNGVKSIDNVTFSGCVALTYITIPNSVTSIGNSAFSNCTSLTSITIPDSVTSISANAFASCRSLNYVVVNATTPPTLGSGVFDNANNCPIYVPVASVDTYKDASGWSNYASRIYPITQVATVDGNPVYNYDIGNKDATVITDTERDKIPTGDSIEFAEGVTQICGQLGAYEEVILPSTFLSFNDKQPINAATTTLTCKATTPPSVERSNLGGSGLTAIYVPASAVDTYKAHAAWGTFSSIIQAIPTE